MIRYSRVAEIGGVLEDMGVDEVHETFHRLLERTLSGNFLRGDITLIREEVAFRLREKGFSFPDMVRVGLYDSHSSARSAVNRYREKLQTRNREGVRT